VAYLDPNGPLPVRGVVADEKHIRLGYREVCH